MKTLERCVTCIKYYIVLLTLGCGLELVALLLPAPLPRLEEPAQRAELALPLQRRRPHAAAQTVRAQRSGAIMFLFHCRKE